MGNGKSIKSTPERDYYLDIIRIIVTFWVVIIHVSAQMSPLQTGLLRGLDPSPATPYP